MNTLWVAVYLPDLALQSATRGLLPQLPVVITQTAGRRPGMRTALLTATTWKSAGTRW